MARGNAERLGKLMHSQIQEISRRTLDAMNEETQQASKDIYVEFGEFQENFIRNVFNDAVTRFYKAYDAKKYKRQGDPENHKGGLYEVLSIKKNEDKLVKMDGPTYDSLYDPSKMHKDRKGNDLYHKVFEEGWHGGAEGIAKNKEKTWGKHPHPGIPYYRKRGMVTYPDGTRKMHKYGKWGKKAEHSTPPAEMIAEELGKAEGNELYKAFQEIGDKHNKLAMQRVNERLAEITNEVYSRGGI